MYTLINGKTPTEAIAAAVIAGIKAANPAIIIDKDTKPEDIPGFKEAMNQPRFIAMDRDDKERYQEVRRKIFRTKRLHKGAAIDFRRTPEGAHTVAAVHKGRDLWEVAIGWDVYIDTAPKEPQNAENLSESLNKIWIFQKNTTSSRC